MSEMATKPNWREAPSGISRRRKGFFGAIRHFWRIRPIPGRDSDTRAGAGGRAISFNDLFHELLADWRVLATTVGAGIAVAAFQISHLPPPTYKVSLNIAPAESRFTSTNDNLIVSSLSIFGRTTTQYDDYAQFLGLMHSVRLAKQLDEKYGLMKKIFPYDEKTKLFVPPPNANSVWSRAMRWTFNFAEWRPPGPVDLADYLDDAVKVERNSNGTATLSYNGPDAQEAGAFLQRIFAETEELMRDEQLKSHRQRREYVAERRAETSTLEQRDILVRLWGQEESQILLLAGGDPVGAKAIDDMHVPIKPDSNAMQRLIVGPLLGLVIGLFIIIVRSPLRHA